MIEGMSLNSLVDYPQKGRFMTLISWPIQYKEHDTQYNQQEPTESCKQLIRTRYISHVTGDKPIRN